MFFYNAVAAQMSHDFALSLNVLKKREGNKSLPTFSVNFLKPTNNANQVLKSELENQNHT